jgi:hypothetical protein
MCSRDDEIVDVDDLTAANTRTMGDLRRGPLIIEPAAVDRRLLELLESQIFQSNLARHC